MRKYIPVVILLIVFSGSLSVFGQTKQKLTKKSVKVSRKVKRVIPFSVVNYYWNMAEQRYLLRSTFKKRF